MKNILLIATLFIGTQAIAQSEVGTIKIRKGVYEDFMRETPKPSRRCCLLPSPCIRNYVIVGAGFNPLVFAELGLEREIFHHLGSMGALLQIAKKDGSKLRLFGEVKVLRIKGSPFISTGVSADIAFDKEVNHAIQPYLGLRIPGNKLERFQLNAGYSFPLGSKVEQENARRPLILGLWVRL